MAPSMQTKMRKLSFPYPYPISNTSFSPCDTSSSYSPCNTSSSLYSPPHQAVSYIPNAATQDTDYEKIHINVCTSRSPSYSSDVSIDDVKSSASSNCSDGSNGTAAAVTTNLPLNGSTYLQSNGSTYLRPNVSSDSSPNYPYTYPEVSDVYYRNCSSANIDSPTTTLSGDARMLSPSYNHPPYLSPQRSIYNDYSALISTTTRNSFSKNSRRKLISDEPVPCALCKRKIENKHLLFALDKYWHEKCLKCDFCRKPLYKFGSRFYFRQGAKFCQEDFMRTFGGRGTCSMCDQVIPPTDYVLRFKGNLVYHLDCFKCTNCRTRFCVGDPVKITDPKRLLCKICKPSQQPHSISTQSHHLSNNRELEDEQTNY